MNKQWIPTSHCAGEGISLSCSGGEGQGEEAVITQLLMRRNSGSAADCGGYEPGRQPDSLRHNCPTYFFGEPLARIFRSAAKPQPKFLSKRKENDREWYSAMDMVSIVLVGRASRRAAILFPRDTPARQEAPTNFFW